MITILNNVFTFFGKLMGYLLPISLYQYTKRLFSRFISGYHIRFLKSTGRNVYFERPFHCVGHKYISIGANFEVRGNCRLDAYDSHNGQNYTPSLTIGNNVAMNFDCHIACVNKIEIGNNVLIASRVFITDHFHGEVTLSDLDIPPASRIVQSKGPVIIEDNVWIGEGVAIMPNITIGKGSIIGANSVVTRSFPAHSIIGGVPAKIIKKL